MEGVTNIKLPEGTTLIPGVVSHATNVIEHLEVVADRILNFASVAGRENSIAGTDCGLGAAFIRSSSGPSLSACRRRQALAVVYINPMEGLASIAS